MAVFASSSTNATDYFRNGVPLTGQSDHIANLQIGLENTERLSQQTLMVTYASKRVVSRGLNGSPPQPDIIESPGLRIDFVVREEFKLFGKTIEGKFEARNLTGRGNSSSSSRRQPDRDQQLRSGPQLLAVGNGQVLSACCAGTGRAMRPSCPGLSLSTRSHGWSST